MRSERTTRVEESRNLEAREAIIRNLKMQFVDKRYIDPSKVPADVDYWWVRMSVRGEPDLSRLPAMERVGWSPVPAERHPELLPRDSSGRLSNSSGHIIIDGLILCERPKEYGVIEREISAEQQYKVMTGIPGLDNFMADPSMPMKVFVNQTQTSRQSSFQD
jgi:hypothetical protein